MDEMVLKAMQKWPNVPHCFGWLAYDQRGDWYMRDQFVQRICNFQQACRGHDPKKKGAKLQHSKLISFIERNYAVDELGQWYFQNGPQRVYVELELAPYVARIGVEGAAYLHTGVRFVPTNAYVDPDGRLYVATPDVAIALVHSLDVLQASELMANGSWPAPEDIRDAPNIWMNQVLSPEKLNAQTTQKKAN